MTEIRALEDACAAHADYFWANRAAVEESVAQICAAIAEKEQSI